MLLRTSRWRMVDVDVSGSPGSRKQLTRAYAFPVAASTMDPFSQAPLLRESNHPVAGKPSTLSLARQTRKEPSHIYFLYGCTKKNLVNGYFLFTFIISLKTSYFKQVS